MHRTRSKSVCVFSVHCYLDRRSVTRFFVSGFFIKQHLLVPIGMPRNDFEFFRIFVELFVFVIDFPAMNTPGSRLEYFRFGSFCEHKSHVPRELKEPADDFQNDRPFKDCCMLLKISKMTPRCPKRLPGDEYTGESITSSNNSSNIRKNSKSFLGVSNETRRRYLI